VKYVGTPKNVNQSQAKTMSLKELGLGQRLKIGGILGVKEIEK
jgi:hypothetical protein